MNIELDDFDFDGCFKFIMKSWGNSVNDFIEEEYGLERSYYTAQNMAACSTITDVIEHIIEERRKREREMTRYEVDVMYNEMMNI